MGRLAAFLLTLLLAAGCRSEREAVAERIRLDLPEDAVQAIVLGTAASESSSEVPDELERPRLPASLLLVDPTPGTGGGGFVALVDPSQDILEQLHRARIRGAVARPGRPLVDAVLLTAGGSAAAAGLAALAREVGAGARVAVYGAAAALADLERADPSAQSFAEGTFAAAPAPPGEPIALGARLTAVPLAVPGGGDGWLAWRFSGATQSLLYMPRMGPLAALGADAAPFFDDVAIVLLDGARYQPAAAAPGPAPAGCHPLIPEQLQFLRSIGLERRIVRFTSLAAANPALPVDAPARRRIQASGADLLRDGTAFGL